MSHVGRPHRHMIDTRSTLIHMFAHEVSKVDICAQITRTLQH
jgi:hypothetical protein